jgi:hypothetical protein
MMKFRGNNKYIYGGTNQRRELSASSEQYFSSMIKGTQKPDNVNANVKAGFEVSAGKNSRGKAIRKAIAFYQFGNFEFQPDDMPEINNAVFSKGDVKDANAAMTVTNGDVTFLGNSKFQNAEAVFDKLAYFGGDVEFPSSSSPTFKEQAYFMGKTTFQNSTTFSNVAYFNEDVEFTASATFNTDAYFGKSAAFKNGTVTFNGRVGFFGTI